MGEIANAMINGDLDYITGEYLGPGNGFPRTFEQRSSKRANKIRKELALLIKTKHKTCTTQQEKNKAVNDARQEINTKYGIGWREK